MLRYRTTRPEGYQEYVSDPVHCRQCELHGQCTTSRHYVKGVSRDIWQKYKDEIDEHRYEARDRHVYKPRKETVKRRVADAKELHGHRYACFRGRHRVQMQCLLSAACRNVKRIPLLLWRGLTGDGNALHSAA